MTTFHSYQFHDMLPWALGVIASYTLLSLLIYNWNKLMTLLTKIKQWDKRMDERYPWFKENHELLLWILLILFALTILLTKL